MGEDSERLVPVFATGSAPVLAIARSMLMEAGIQYMTRNEMLQDLFALGRIGGFNPVSGPAQILVLESDAEEAQRILKVLDE